MSYSLTWVVGDPTDPSVPTPGSTELVTSEAEGHAINGVWLKELGCEMNMALNLPEIAGEDIYLPYNWYEIPGTHVPRGRDYNIEVVIAGFNYPAPPSSDARGIYLERVRRMAAVFFNNAQPFILTRKLTLSAGLELTVETQARYVDGFDVEKLAASIGHAIVRLRMLWPSFYPLASIVQSGITGDSVTLTAPGDVRTNKVILTIPGSTTVENLTNNTRIDVASGDDVTVDVFQRTALSGGTSAMARTTFTSIDNSWFTLDPGDNSLSVSGGSVSIEYWPAYL